MHFIVIRFSDNVFAWAEAPIGQERIIANQLNATLLKICSFKEAAIKFAKWLTDTRQFK